MHVPLYTCFSYCTEQDWPIWKFVAASVMPLYLGPGTMWRSIHGGNFGVPPGNLGSQEGQGLNCAAAKEKRPKATKSFIIRFDGFKSELKRVVKRASYWVRGDLLSLFSVIYWPKYARHVDGSSIIVRSDFEAGRSICMTHQLPSSFIAASCPASTKFGARWARFRSTSHWPFVGCHYLIVLIQAGVAQTLFFDTSVAGAFA